jgi:hypothetical protein
MVAGTAWEPTPGLTVQRAAWKALRKTDAAPMASVGP